MAVVALIAAVAFTANRLVNSSEPERRVATVRPATDDPATDAPATAEPSAPAATPSAGVGDGLPGGTRCTWLPVPAEERTTTTVDVGAPPTSVPAAGARTLAVNTQFGAINVSIDVAKVPCTTASLAHLAGKGFFDGTKCHRMFPGMLQCGDPSAKGKGYRESDGTGGPAYRFAHENLPVAESPPYPAGVMAMANSGQPETNGSQFFFTYQDLRLNPDYTVVGKLTKESQAVLAKATAKGHDGVYDSGPGGGHPRSDITIRTLTVR